jgi:hypothetical protein
MICTIQGPIQPRPMPTLLNRVSDGKLLLDYDAVPSFPSPANDVGTAFACSGVEFD